MSLFKDNKRYFEQITKKEAIEHAPLFGYELLEMCPQCEFYLVKDENGRAYAMTHDCEHRREDIRRRKQVRELGENTLVYYDKYHNKKCYVIKRLTKCVDL